MTLDLDQPILTLGGKPFTYRDTFEGTAIFGGSGSGKSEGVGRRLAEGYLKAGYGGLVLTCKENETARWARYMGAAGRSRDFLPVAPRSGHRFDFMAHEAERPTRGGGLTKNITQLFTSALDTKQARNSDPYWEQSLNELLTASVNVNLLAEGTVSLDQLADTIATAPTSGPKSIATSRAAGLLRTVARRMEGLSAEENATFNELRRFWGASFPRLNSKTRSIIVSCFTSKAADLLTGPLRALFAEPGPPTFAPELSRQGKVIVLDMPLHSYTELGRFAQRLYKAIWQATMLQTESSDPRPVFLWIDEAHEFLSSADTRFQAACRESRCAGVYLSQNLPNYYAAFGAADSKEGTEGFLGCCRTKMFMQNPEPTTNEWASRLFGSRYDIIEGRSEGEAHPIAGPTNYLEAPPSSSNTTSWNEQERPRVPPAEFGLLEYGPVAETLIYYRNAQLLREWFPTR